jgi:hypothetical protein
VCELGELVEVDLSNLDLSHAPESRLGQAMLDHLARRQQRRRIDRQHAEPIEGHGPLQRPRGGQ